MKIKASIVVMSHLSDIKEELGSSLFNQSILIRCEFAKFVILHCNGDLRQEIDPDELYTMYSSENVFVKKSGS